jgi:AraC-like DNA-binding protein
VGEIAERLNVSAEHLARVFKQQTGISPHVHIQNAKMLAACGMLKSESLPVKEIAWRLGYETPANFMRTFQRVIRCTPIQFRKNGVVPLALGTPASHRKPKPPVVL